MSNDHPDILRYHHRDQWRHWLETHFQTKHEAWLVYPKKHTGKPRISYNDAVEEALCFGWIDSINRTLDTDHTMQRFTPRKPKSTFSQPNVERLRWLDQHNLIHPDIRPQISSIIDRRFVFPADIMQAIQEDPVAWQHFSGFSPAYQRIRVAYIESARKRPEEFQKRLRNFIDKTRAGQQIRGYGGIDKYY